MKKEASVHNENFKIIANQTEVMDIDDDQNFYNRPKRAVNGGYELSPLPRHVDIELTNVCDLECGFCETLVMKRPKGMMSLKTFKQVVDQCAKMGVRSAKLNLWGESLLNKNLGKMIQYAKENSDLTLQFNANANRLSAKLARQLVTYGLDRMTISVDGITKETYEKLRVKGNYERVLENIHRLLKIRKEEGVSTPHVTLQIVRTKDNIDEIDDFVEYWEQHADQVSVTNIGITSDTSVLRFSVRQGQKSGRKPCMQPWQRLSVLWDGSVTVCCKDYEGHLVVGDVNTSQLMDMWNCDAIQEIRKRHIDKNFEGMVCDTCTDSVSFNGA